MTKTRDLSDSVNDNSIPGERLQDQSLPGDKIDPASPIPASSASFNLGLVGSVDRSASSKLADFVNVKDFGAIGDGISDDTTAIQAALDSGVKQIMLGDAHYITDELTVPSDVSVIGNGVSTITADFSAFGPPPGNFSRKSAFRLSAGDTLLKDIVITTLPANRTDSRNGANMDPWVNGVRVNSGSYLQNVQFKHGWIGFTGVGPVKMLTCGTSDTRYAAINYYNTENIEVIGGSYLNCGGFGGLTFPSCRKIRVEGTYVTNLESTGINPGGSSTPGFNAEDVTIVNNVVYAREAINPENGVNRCTITGNVVYFGATDPANGVGIGVHTHLGGGPINDITISSNTVYIIPGSSGAQIPLQVGPGNAFELTNCSITNNVTHGNVGLWVRGTCSNVVVSDNVFNGSTWGIRLGTISNLTVANNYIETSTNTTIGNYYGISIEAPLTNALITGNTTKGFGSHYLQNENCTNTSIFDCVFVKNDDNVNFSRISYGGSVTDQLSVENRLRPQVVSGLNPSLTVPESVRCGLAILRANVNGAPESNESVSLWLVMNSRDGASIGYTVEGISVALISGLKHDFAGAIANCSLLGDTATNTLTVNPGGFNTFTLSFIPIS